MLSPRFIDGLRLAPALLVMLAVAGCAGSGSVRAPEPDAVEVAETDQPVIPADALTLYEQAVAVMASGDFVDAELRFKEFLLLYPEYPGTYVNLAIIQTRNGNDEEARSVLDAALALDPAHPAALNQLGMLLRRNGKFIEAEAAYMKAVTAMPAYALAHYNLGVLNELYLQRLDKALEHFEAYQALVGEDKQVDKWISDLKRRVAASQKTANTAD